MEKKNRLVIYALITISMIASLYVGVLRINVENEYDDVQIAIRYSDVLRIQHETDMTLEEILIEFKEAGATTLFLRENTLIPSARGEFYNYKEQGKAMYYEGYELEKFHPGEEIAREYIYIETFDQETYNKIYYNLKEKGMSVDRQIIAGKDFIKLSPNNAALISVGLGFNYEDLEIAANLGYSISPQVKEWSTPTEDSISFVAEQIELIPNLDTIYFADNTIPGASHEDMIRLVEEYGLGYVEFFSGTQQGFKDLALSTGEEINVSRLHTVGDDEIGRYTVSGLMDRYMLALTERNLRTFLFKMPQSLDIEKDMNYITQAIGSFKQRAEDKGFNVGTTVEPLNLPGISTLLTFIVGLGAIGIFILLMDYLGFVKLGYILGALGTIGYLGLLVLAPNFGAKLMALFASIIFPTYAIASNIQIKSEDLKLTLITFLKMCMISFGGALTVVGVLSRTKFALGIDIFMGVKLVYIAPIALIVLILIYKEHGLDIKFYKAVLSKNISYFAVALLAVVGVLLLFYTSRTGNGGQISSLEANFRQLLDTVLGVRPRTTEILIGYPLMIALLYFGYRELYIPIVVFAVMGQISLVNTYAHLHTPLTISLVRSTYGLIIGTVVGVVLIYIIKLGIKVMNRCLVKVK